MKLNKKLELAISAVAALKTRVDFVKTSDLAQQVGTSEHFLQQIMLNLRTAGLVEVKRGRNGGFQLARDKVITAFLVAQAVGRDFGTLSFDQDPNSRLRRSIMTAYLETEI